MKKFLNPLYPALERLNTPCFIFNINKVEENLKAIESIWAEKFKDFELAYSIKTNNLKEIVQLIGQHSFGVDVVSKSEIKIAEENNIPYSKIYFNGPYKKKNEISYAVKKNINIQFDCEHEIKQFIKVIAGTKIEPKIALRISHPLDSDSYSRFGFNDDELTKALTILEYEKIKLSGLHFHFGKTALKKIKLPRIVKFILEKIEFVLRYQKSNLQWINIGGGLSKIEEHRKFSEIFYNKIKTSSISNFPLKLVIEPGRSVVQNTGYLLSSVISIKERVERVITIDASKTLLPSRGEEGKIFFLANKTHSNKIKGSIYGSNCFENDIFAKLLEIPENVEYVIFDNVGAYDFSTGHLWTRQKPSVYTVKNKIIKKIR